MKKIAGMSFFAAALLYCASAFCADLPKEYSAVAVELSVESTAAALKEGYQIPLAWILVAKSGSESAVKSAFSDIASADADAMAGLITKSKDLKRAVKFAKGSKLRKIAESMAAGKEDINVFKVGRLDVAVFGKQYAMRPGMNFMVFENSGGRLLWNVSFSDPLMLLLAGGRLSDFPDVAAPMPGDAKTIDLLAEKKLPIPNFKNGVLVSLEADENVERGECAKFYHAAQAFFFDCKLKEYSQFMTKQSRARFESQFMSMPESEQRSVLKDYFSWKKRYLRAMECGGPNAVVIFFARERAGDPTQNDIACFVRENGDFKLANWGAKKSPLDMFLSKYILKDGEYYNNISKRFSDR